MSKWTGRHQHHTDSDTVVPNELLINKLKELKLSARSLALKVGMNEIDMCYLKQGRMLPSYEEAERIAREICCTPEELFPEFKNMPNILKKFINRPKPSKPQIRYVLDEKLKFLKSKGEI